MGLVCSHAVALERVVLQLDGAMSFGKSGYFVAIEKGYYADEGLEVEIRPGENRGEVCERLLSNEVQFGNAPATALLDYLGGKPLVAISAIHQDTGYGLLVRHDSGIATPQDLVGKTIVASGGGQDHEIMAVFVKAGVDLETITFLGHNEDIHAERRADYLLEGRADAIVLRIAPHALAPFLEAGVPVRSLKPSDYGVRFYQNLTLTSRPYLESRPRVVAAFHRATLRGWRYAITHPNETVDVYATRYVPLYPELDAPPEIMVNKAISQFERIGVDGIGAMDIERWQQIADAYAEMGMAEPGRSLGDFIYDPTPDRAWVGWALGFGVWAVLLALTALLWNRQLSRRVADRTELLERSKRQQTLMMQELDHRVKNNLAVVMSLSNQTLDACDSLTQFSEVFNGRLRVMASTHEALAKSRWKGVSLNLITRLSLRDAVNQSPETFQIEGPEITLPPRAVIPLSLTLHELGADALRHGALKSPQGRVRLAWSSPEADTLVLTWSESGGPIPVGSLETRGGLDLIRGLIEYQLQGQTHLEFTSEGLRCRLQIPLDQLADSRTPDPQELLPRADAPLQSSA